jgi:replication initiation and membrane attachment protein
MELNGLDKFKLITYQNLDLDERNVITLLYQPLLGCDAFTLYLTLWSLIERARLKSPEYLHLKVYDIMRISPKQFLRARQKLEAIGLLVAYKNEDIFLYELKAPLSAEEFIKDGSLGAYLFSRLGKENFDDLVNLFRISKSEKEGFTNITTNFDEVFESLPRPIETNDDFISKSKAKFHINHSFNFEIFIDGLSKNFVDRRKISKAIKEKIMNISYVYNLDEFTMQKVFMDSVDKNRNIDIEKLSYNARKWFEFERETIFEETKIKNKKEAVSYEELLNRCKTDTPSIILAILSNGKPSVTELKVVEKLIDNYEFKIEVINFLLVYVIGLLEEFPSYNYFDKIAIEWQRKKVNNIDDAIKVIKNRQTRLENHKNKPKGKNLIPKDVESDWFDEYMKNR